MNRLQQLSPHQPDVLLESCASGIHSQSYRFSGCEAVIRADNPDQVADALAEVELAVARGRHAAGFVSYEAASGLNPDLPVMDKGTLPLVWFGVFADRVDCSEETTVRATGDCLVSTPELSITGTNYLSTVKKIRAAIARGETYQVNFTTRQRFNVSGDPFTLYRRMCRNQQAPYCAWLDIGTHQILSASPELFFALDGDRLTMKPMKGTAPRSPRTEEDQRQREQLATTAKDRAENLMIVDLVRNDLARIAETGSIEVPAMFDIETYPTVHQMTSTVTARLRPEIGLTEIFRALFPCGSITGAPKRRTMEIIRGLEGQPRGVYCGAIGYVSPGREAVFSVAIRTVVVNAATGKAELGIGSGITWDSEAGSEYEECLVKGRFLTRDVEDFSLIESIRHDSQGYLLLERHLRRLALSAGYFGIPCNLATAQAKLTEQGISLHGIHKVRLLLASDGSFTAETQELAGSNSHEIATVAISDQRFSPDDPFLYHKSTNRQLYDNERKKHPHCYDVIFFNSRGELCEGSYNNIVLSLGGTFVTPALECGLLPGVLREELLEVGAIEEAVLTAADLHSAKKIWLVNSVRGWRECTIKIDNA